MKKRLLLLACCSCLSCFAQDDGRVIKILVIFHILYADSLQDNGINADTRNNGNNTGYLTKEKILAELNDLDRDFQLLNPDTQIVISEFKHVIGNPKVHFYLAEIKYLKVDKNEIDAPHDNLDLIHSLSPIVDPSKYLNVYIGEIKFQGSYTNGVSPVKNVLNGNQGFDVVNINYKWVGLNYRLLTHEVGHWLGLWHTWQDDSRNDGINDIPLTKIWTNMDCVSCPPVVRDQIRRHTGFVHSNYNNFMDYSGCRVMFSIKQAQRIRYVVQNFRPQLWINSAVQ